ASPIPSSVTLVSCLGFVFISFSWMVGCVGNSMKSPMKAVGLGLHATVMVNEARPSGSAPEETGSSPVNGSVKYGEKTACCLITIAQTTRSGGRSVRVLHVVHLTEEAPYGISFQSHQWYVVWVRAVPGS